MNIASHIVVFAVAWWLVLFMVLPVGVRTSEEAGEESEPGTAESAPTNPRLGLKMLVTTGIATVLWLVFWMVVEFDLITIERAVP